MVQVLGDGAAQARIRDGSVKPHCRILADNPSACLKCTLPENPYHPEKKPDWNAGIVAIVERGPLLNEAVMFFRDWQAGLIGRRELLSMPAEYGEVSRICRQEWGAVRRRNDADYQAAKLGEIIGKTVSAIFGKK